MLDRDKILRATGDGLHIFRHYIAGDWILGRCFHNPLYNDTKASCNIFFDKKSRVYRMKDFGVGTEHYSGDCFHIVGICKGLDSNIPHEFVEILEIINRELSLGFSDDGEMVVRPQKIKPKQDIELHQQQPSNETKKESVSNVKNYSYEAQPFSRSELEFWSCYGIEENILLKYKVKSISKFQFISQQGRTNCYRSQSNEPMFGYAGSDFMKIYRPFSSLRFFYGGTIPEPYCFGLDQLPTNGDVLYIVGGEKDVMSMSARGFNSICLNSETSHIPPEMINTLSFRFRHIVIMYDADKTGKEAATKHQQQLAKFNVMRLVLPLPGTKEAKDISDFFRLGNNAEELKSLFVELLRKRYSKTVSILNSCRISMDTPPPESEVIISINDVPLGTNGNLLCITGGEGTGKSNFIGALIAGAINKRGIDIDTLGVKVAPHKDNMPILLFDTEQSQAQLYKNSKTIARRAALDRPPDNFVPYTFTSLQRNARLISIEESLEICYHHYGGVHMVVIDGIADLISGANNEPESIDVVERLYKMAANHNTCVVCVLHFIPNGLKLRGHLGSELQRKSASIIAIEKDGEGPTSIIKALKVRDGSPLDVPIIQFEWDKKAEMHLYKGEKSKAERDERKFKELQDAANKIFANKPYLSYQDLSRMLQEHFDVKDRAAKRYISYMREKDIIINDPSNADYLIIGYK